MSSLERDNIDPKRVENDMVVGHYTNKDGRLVVGRVVPREGEPNWGTVERRIERVNEAQKAAGKRATRKDAVVMADVVVTLPDNVRKGDEDRFFRLTYWYLSNKFGIDNMMGGFVHKDEELRSRISRPLEYLMPKPKTERFGLDDVMREATRAAEAYNRSHAAQPTTSRSRGQSR